MNLITKLTVLNSSKYPNQVLKTFTTTPKNNVPLFYHANPNNYQNRSKSLPCRPVNSFGIIELLQRSVSPTPYLIRRAQISYMSNKLDLVKEWQSRSTRKSRTSLEERKFSTTSIKNSSKTNTSNCSVPNRKFSRLKDVIKKIFGKKSQPSKLTVDELAKPIPNMKMKIVPYSSGKSSTKVEITHVDLEEQKRLTPYLYNYKHSLMDVNVRPMSNYGRDVDNKKKPPAKPPIKRSKTYEQNQNSKSKIVEVICPDIDNVENVVTAKKGKYVPFQNMDEEVIEPKVPPKSPLPVVSVADICKEVDKSSYRNRRRKSKFLPGKGDRHVVSYPVKRNSTATARSKIPPKREIPGKAKSLDEPQTEPKIKMSNYWAKPKSKRPSGLSSKPAKVEPCDPYKDSKRKLSNVSYKTAKPNLNILSCENYSNPAAVDSNLPAWYESPDNIAMENLTELRKNQTSFEVPKPNVLCRNKALATSHVDMLNTQLLCSNLFSTPTSKQFSENLQPFHIRSYLSQPNCEISDLGILNLVVTHDRENNKAECEKYKTEMFNLRPKKIRKLSFTKMDDDTAKIYDEDSEIKESEHETETIEPEETEPKATKATTKNNEEKNSPSKPITFIKKDFHTVSSLKTHVNRKLPVQASSIAYSTKSKKDDGKKVVHISDKVKKDPEICKVDEVIKRVKLKQGRSIMRHTEWKAVSIKGMKSPAQELAKLIDEREKYKELIRMRSNTREVKEPEKCILVTPFDEIPEPKCKPQKPKTPESAEKPIEPECQSRTYTKVILSTSTKTTNYDCGCVSKNSRRPSSKSNEIIDTRAKLKCVKKKCEQSEESKQKLHELLYEIEESAKRLKSLEKLKRKNKNYNSNCDTTRSRNLRR